MAPAVCVLLGFAAVFGLMLYEGLSGASAGDSEGVSQAASAIVGGGFFTALIFIGSLPVLIVGFLLSSRKRVLYCESCGASVDSI